MKEDYNNTNEPKEESNIEEYSSSKNEFSKSALIMRRLDYCGMARAAEMREGYWNEKLDRDGNIARSYVEDARKNYISSVESLKTLLASEILSDFKNKFKRTENESNKFVDFLKQFEGRKKKIFDSYAYHELRYISNGKWKPTGRVYMPSPGESLPTSYSRGQGSFYNPKPVEIEYIKGTWDSRVNNYWNEMVILYDELLAELILLIARTGNFKKKLQEG